MAGYNCHLYYNSDTIYRVVVLRVKVALEAKMILWAYVFLV